MAMRTCVQCGQGLDEKAKFCGQCGTVVEENRAAPATANRTLLALPQQPPAGAATAPGPLPPAKRTIVGLPSIGTESPAARTAQALSSARRTMVGISPPTAGTGSPGGAPGAAGPPGGAPPAAPMRRTMVGVAMPGIAPLHPGMGALPPGVAPLTPGIAPLPGGPMAPVDPGADTAAALSAGSTLAVPPGMLPMAGGGGMPAPPRAMSETMPIPAFFVPPPAPIEEAPPPVAPRPARRPGAPLFVAALIAGGVAIVGGAAIALLWRGAPPISAQPRIAADGKDVLHLTCDTRSCADGTIASLDGAKSTFLGGEADLPLARPLHVGDNTLALAIDRPGMGRDETVKLIVPVAYRVRADVTTMEGPHPGITIRVEAPPGTDVRVEDKPVALDASGQGSYVVDESATTEGPADESRVVSVDVPYVVMPKGHAPETGTVSARIAVAPLRVDSPGPATTTDEDTIVIAGRAARGATATIGGATVTVGPDGSFESTVNVASPGDHPIEVRAGTSVLAPRTVRIMVTRVASLVDAAKAFEAQAPIGYDTAVHDLAAAKTGQPIVVEGDVVEARGSGHSTVVLIDDHRGCSKGPCIVRVVVGKGMTLAHGESLKAYGRVARTSRTPTAQTVPEVEAEFVLRAKP